MTPHDPSWISELGIDLDHEGWIDRLREARASHALGELAGYELEAEIGRGGQGVVYRARRNGSSVAVKRILAGPFASPERQRRFEREVEAVRSLDHPGIVRLLDALSVRDASILVMEWIEGTPITEWARPDGKRRPVREIVVMMRRVCEAVLFAHQRGVIHRDLKPSNLLVDRTGRPHLLDFGLAKLRGAAPASTLTTAGSFLGTLAYASPEQIEGNDGIDARSDVYSLGVILYEMLTGATPHEVDGSIAATVRAVTTEDPPLPSALAADVDKSLDAVVSRALAKDPVRRYQSADAFSADLERCLSGEPVEAKPRSLTYVLERFTRRHPVSSSVIGGLVLLVVAFGVTMGVLYRRSEREALRARRVQSVLENTLVASPTAGEDPTEAVHILDRAATSLGPELAGEPEIEMRVHGGLARRYLEARGYEQATFHAERAIALARELGERGDEARMAALRVAGLASIHEEDPAAVEWLRQALDVHRERYGDDHPVVAEIRHHLGYAYWRCLDPADLESARRELTAAIETYARVREGPNWREADAIRDYAALLREVGEPEAAIVRFEAALEIMDELPSGSFLRMRAETLVGLGSALSRAGRWDEMEDAYLRALALRDGRLDANVPPCYANVGNSLFYRDRFDEALEYYHAAVVARLELLSQSHPAHRADLVLAAARIRTEGLRASMVPEVWRLISVTEPGILPLFRFTSGKIADSRERLEDAASAEAIRRALVACPGYESAVLEGG